MLSRKEKRKERLLRDVEVGFIGGYFILLGTYLGDAIKMLGVPWSWFSGIATLALPFLLIVIMERQVKKW